MNKLRDIWAVLIGRLSSRQLESMSITATGHLKRAMYWEQQYTILNDVHQKLVDKYNMAPSTRAESDRIAEEAIAKIVAAHKK